MKDNENKFFREQTVIKSNCDEFCFVETILKNKAVPKVEGYTFICLNRGHLHKKAKRGSGGVGLFVRNTLLNIFNVTVLDGILLKTFYGLNYCIEKMFSQKT